MTMQSPYILFVFCNLEVTLVKNLVRLSNNREEVIIVVAFYMVALVYRPLRKAIYLA